VGGTRLAFLSCHLAAHAGEANAALRASQLRAALDAGARACAPSSSSSASAEVTRLEDMHHHTFVFGDLNFRIDGDAFLSASRADAAAAPSDAASNDASHAPLLPPPADAPPAALSLRSVTAAALGGAAAPAGDAWRAVAAAVAARRWEELRRADELRGELREGRALEGYQEGPLTFPPTFKLVRGSGSGSHAATPQAPMLAQGKSGGVATAPAPPPRAYATKRIPSWTDRCVRDVARVDCSAAQAGGAKAHLMRMIAC
jgi:hypothetical protein